MRLHSVSKLAFALMFVLAFGVSCAGCQEDPPPPAPDTTQTDNGGFKDDGVEDRGAPEVSVPELSSVYFEYDQATITADQKATLRSNAEAIRSGSWSTVVVEGHCDERGSEEYNLGLGERRASAVKQYLIDSGISSSRIDTVSFGEARPAARGHDETAWSKNRRAEFRVVR